MRVLLLAIMVMTLGGCQSHRHDPISLAENVDIPRFMGDWYVIAHIPLPPERQAWNGIERYDLNDDGSIATTFTFRLGSAEGEKKRYTPTAWVTDDPSNAVWKMQFLWPFKADFRIIWLDDDYQTTIIGRQKRDYVWVMARQPEIDEKTYQAMLNFLKQEGYELSDLRKVPQQW
ncbi:lipocalin family protein [Alcanivorax sp. 1008]|uniref:lipocalin family protein n=1 Tax=Alcanivorax sp. 1008 TaxID=2816853 RepID=UPI001D22C732|nr:lipocalin family protein [Alcanivorax sp. 1008]MCC1495375.1 lipocalin family protein [Alcanivorax sp. 1008]